MTTPVRLWRYYLPNEKPLEGWAEIVIGSNGFFAAVSDYGNYAYAWRAHGEDDVRKFFLRAVGSPDYLAGKLSPGMEYDSDATLRAVRDHILERRRTKAWTADRARIEWNLLDRFSDLYSEYDLHLWSEETSMNVGSDELVRRRRSFDVTNFCTKTIPRLAAMIRAELETEARGAA